MRTLSFGRYQLLQPIGRGGMGEIWQALSGERLVVIKRLLPHLCDDSSFAKLFRSEAAVLAQLDHPNIVRVLDVGEVDGELFIAMELIDGVDLNRILNAPPARRPVPIGVAVQVALGLCRALGHAHAARSIEGRSLDLIHRDVSPTNVMLGFDGQVKLLDFGIAKVLGESGPATQGLGRKGKIGYLSPEALAGTLLDRRADLFGVGIVLYELLSGSPLFWAKAPAEVSRRMSTPVSPPSESRPEISPALDSICVRALAIDRDARYDTAADMEAALLALPDATRSSSSEIAAYMSFWRRPTPSPVAADDATVSVLGDRPALDEVPRSIRSPALKRTERTRLMPARVFGAIAVGTVLIALSARLVQHAPSRVAIPSRAADGAAPLERIAPRQAEVVAPVPAVAGAARQAISSLSTPRGARGTGRDRRKPSHVARTVDLRSGETIDLVAPQVGK